MLTNYHSMFYEPHNIEEILSLGFPTRSDKNELVNLQKISALMRKSDCTIRETTSLRKLARQLTQIFFSL